jgi:peptidoglycan-associated lipoprotein
MKTRQVTVIAIAAVSLIAAGCTKKHPVAQTAPPAAPAASQPEVRRPEPAPTPKPAAEKPAVVAETPKSRYPDAATRRKIEELLARIQDAYFDYDRHSLRTDAQQTLDANAKELGNIVREYPDYKMQVQGYCDERGSAEYNLALGEKRAQTAKEYLVSMGVPAEQLTTISYGKEQKACSEHDESCWQKNRRVHIVAMAR